MNDKRADERSRPAAAVWAEYRRAKANLCPCGVRPRDCVDHRPQDDPRAAEIADLQEDE